MKFPLSFKVTGTMTIFDKPARDFADIRDADGELVAEYVWADDAAVLVDAVNAMHKVPA